MFRNVLLVALLGFAGLNADLLTPEFQVITSNIIVVSQLESEAGIFEDDVPSNLPYPMEPNLEEIVPESEGMADADEAPYAENLVLSPAVFVIPSEPGVPVVPDNGPLQIQPEDDDVLEIVPNNLPLFIVPESEREAPSEIDFDEEVPNNLPYPMEPPAGSPSSVEVFQFPEEGVPNPGQQSELVLEIVPNNLPLSVSPDGYFEEDVPNNLPYPMEPLVESVIPESEGLNAAGSRDVSKDSVPVQVRPLPIEVPELAEEDAVPCVIDEDFLQPWPPAEEIEEIIPEEDPENCEDEVEGDGSLTLPNPLPPPETLPIITDPVDEESDVIYAPEGEDLPYFTDEDGNWVYKDPNAEEDVLCELPSEYYRPLPIVPDNGLPVVAPR
ncbi:hypothetical protein Trydic_g3087 [Trypoxylus dichotomus]